MKAVIDGISVEIVRKNIKNLHIYIKPPAGSVLVTAPYFLSSGDIEAFVRSRRDWIEKNQKKIQAASFRPLSYEDGSFIYIQGKKYLLRIVSGKRASLTIRGSEAVLTAPENSTCEKRKNIITEWYREFLRGEISRLMPKWESISGLKCSDWQIKNMKTRWGTCNISTRKIWLNLKLAEKPEKCLEYVILHELCHLKESGHNARFYALLDKFMPEWKEYRNMLKEYPSYI